MIASDLKIIEALHTINDNAYIKNLEKSLQAANIQVKEDILHKECEKRGLFKMSFVI